jgi:hypothetical protein
MEKRSAALEDEVVALTAKNEQLYAFLLPYFSIVVT